MKMNDINFKGPEIDGIIEKNKYFSAIEAILFMSGEPLKLNEITSILGLTSTHCEGILNELMQNYEAQDRGIKLIRLDNKFQFITKPQNSNYIQQLLKINSRQSLSQGALETLAIVAYKQPITRMEIDEIRGVKSDRAISSLAQKNLIIEYGRMETAGRPILYATTDEFLKSFEIQSIKELVKIDELNDKNEFNQNRV